MGRAPAAAGGGPRGSPAAWSALGTGVRFGGPGCGIGRRPVDIRDAASTLAVRVDTDHPTWPADEDRRLVTERLVEIIAEAARAMSPEARARFPDVDRAGLVGLRNILVHAYHRTRPALLWRAATVDIPATAGRPTIWSCVTGAPHTA